MTKNILAFFVVLVFDDGLCHLFVHGPGVVDLLNHDPGDLLVVATDLRTLLTLRAAKKAMATFCSAVDFFTRQAPILTPRTTTS